MPVPSSVSLISKYSKLFMVGFTFLIFISLILNTYNTQQETERLALLEAKTNLNKDRAFRLWATKHGGSYFVVDQNTQPSRFLAHVPERDITTSSGKTLTLYNPATMLREIMHDYSKLYGVKARITSDIYMNPENAPDEWEAKALQELKKGKKEFQEVSVIDGKSYLRVMQPLYMDKGCMKCHAWTGLKVGDLRGATDVAVPLEQYETVKQENMVKLILSHIIVWILGLASLSFLTNRLMKSERKLEVQRKNLHILSQALEQSANGILITDSKGIIEYSNKALERLNGYSRKELVGHSPNKFKSNLNPPEMYKEMWSTITKGETWKGEFKNRKKNGDIYWCYETISPVVGPDGEITNYIAIVENIEDRKSAEEHIKHLAKYDPLTNLPNRHFFHTKLEMMITDAEQNHAIFGLIYVDLDRFKMVNDSLGHPIGDILLITLAERFNHMEIDQHPFIARLGGDEFAIITPLIDSKESIESYIETIQKIIKEPFLIQENDIFMTASIGIALYPQDGKDSETLIKSSDIAMYGAKIKGKNTHAFFEPLHGDFASETLLIENGLRKAIDNDELFLVYQPKWDTQKNRFLGLEVLVRWNSPTQGFMNPGRFIAIAEETDLIIVLGEWILRHALMKMMELSHIVGFVPNISVNLSPVQFRNEHLNKMIKNALHETRFPPEKLELEITEGALVHNPTLAIEKMSDLCAKGVTFSIDDFGTGYSSMSYLKKFPISTLKIDKSFVDDIIDDPHDRAIIQAIITLAESFEIQTIAEGAETSQQVEILNALGCYAIQGYWHSRPIDFHSLITYFQTMEQ